MPPLVPRQVRLDDDVIEWVEARAQGLSLSGATNRLLRAHVRAEQPLRAVAQPRRPRARRK